MYEGGLEVVVFFQTECSERRYGRKVIDRGEDFLYDSSTSNDWGQIFTVGRLGPIHLVETANLA